MGPEDLPLPTTFGPYQLIRLIGAGGMARVYEARLAGLHGFEKRLAIKMMLPEHAGDTEFVTMLIDEAKIAVALNHSNICQVHDLGCIDDRYYIAMEYVEGADLNKVVNTSIRKRIPIPFDLVALVGQDICSGLDYAHAKVDDQGAPLNIIHRDISPANILLSMSGEVKIVDFGVAKATSRSQHTTVGVVKGKYQYMSPEQITGKQIDHRSDIFAAGIVLYETIAGRMMYPEGADMLDRIRTAKMRPLRQLRPDVPSALERIIATALKRRPHDRYQHAGEMGEALVEFRLHWQAKHGRGRLDELMEKLFGDLLGPRRPSQQLPSKPPPPKQAPVIRRRPKNEKPSHGEETPTWKPPPPAPPEATNDAAEPAFAWDEEGESTRADPKKPDLPLEASQHPRSEQNAASRPALAPPVIIDDPPSPFSAVPDDFDDEDEEEDEPTIAYDSSTGAPAVNEEDDDDDDEDDDEYDDEYDEGEQTLATGNLFSSEGEEESLVDLSLHLDEPVETATEMTVPHLEPPSMQPRPPGPHETRPPEMTEAVSEDTLELSSTEEALDVDIDVDLSLMKTPKKQQTSALFLIRDAEGTTSGPFTRSQLYDMALANRLTLDHEVTPTRATDVPEPARGDDWFPPGLFISDSDTEFEAQIAFQLPRVAQSHAVDLEPFAHILLRMAAEEQSGVLICDRLGVHKEVTVNNGKPTYASSNLPEEQLGIQLRRRGLLSSEGLAHALGVALKEHRPLPEVLVRLGLIEREPVEAHLEQMIRGRLLELFRWTSGRISSHRGDVDAAPVDYEINPLHLIREGIQSIAGHDGPSSWLRQQTDKTFILTGESPKPLKYMGLTGEAIEFLERFTVPMSVAEIIELVVAEQIDHEEIAAAVLVAFQVGFLAAVAE